MESPLPGLIDELRRGLPLRGACRLGQREVHQKPMLVLHQRMAHEVQLGFPPLGFPGEQSFGVGRALMRGVAAPVASEVDAQVARIVGWRLIGWPVLGPEGRPSTASIRSKTPESSASAVSANVLMARSG
jgi:hypothetical protein